MSLIIAGGGRGYMAYRFVVYGLDMRASLISTKRVTPFFFDPTYISVCLYNKEYP
jgi:hypothetical protein